MSRIYEALARASNDAGADVPAPARDAVQGLEAYSREQPGARSADVPASPKPELSPVRLSAGDFEGKLVSQAEAVVAERYRGLATTLYQAHLDRGLQTVVVTSAVPGEGKTLTVVNLGLTLSESYRRRVLLIDADLRSPSVHRALGIPNRTGLTDAITGLGGQLPIIQVSPLLSVMPAGRAESSPLARLSSGRLQTLIDECASQFDWVLVDTPPVGIVADAQLLARRVHGVLFVIRAGAAPFQMVEKAVSDLGRECIIGTVLNGIEARHLPSDAHYDYYGRFAGTR